MKSDEIVKIIKAAHKMGVESLNIGADGSINVVFNTTPVVKEEKPTTSVVEFEAPEETVIEENDKRDLEDTLYELDLLDPVEFEKQIESGKFVMTSDGSLRAEIQ